MDTSKMVRVYLKMREARTELKRQYEAQDSELKGKMEKLEVAMLRFLNENKIENVATPAGTFYKQEEVTPTGSDWEAFYDWVKRNDAFDALERRIKKTFVKEYMETNGGAVPPGVSVFREHVVRVRRSS